MGDRIGTLAVDISEESLRGSRGEVTFRKVE